VRENRRVWVMSNASPSRTSLSSPRSNGAAGFEKAHQGGTRAAST
jgi:hypothetical protein